MEGANFCISLTSKFCNRNNVVCSNFSPEIIGVWVMWVASRCGGFLCTSIHSSKSHSQQLHRRAASTAHAQD